jgi:hypothetical protein
MPREFKEVVEVTTVTEEYYRYIPSGLVATLDEIHVVRSQRSLKGDYTTKYVVTFPHCPKSVWGVEFLNGNWEKISREEYWAYTRD